MVLVWFGWWFATQIPICFYFLSQCDSQLLGFGIEASIKLIMRSWVSPWNMMNMEWINGWSIVDALWSLSGGLENFILESSWACQTALPSASIEPASVETLREAWTLSRLLLKQLAIIFAGWWDMTRSKIHTFGGTKKLSPPFHPPIKILDTEPCCSAI